MYQKTVVAEIKKSYATVMGEDGNLHRIKLSKGMRIGDRIYYLDEDNYRRIDKKRKKPMSGLTAVMLSAASILLLTTPLMHQRDAVSPAPMLTERPEEKVAFLGEKVAVVPAAEEETAETQSLTEKFEITIPTFEDDDLDDEDED